MATKPANIYSTDPPLLDNCFHHLAPTILLLLMHSSNIFNILAAQCCRDLLDIIRQ